MAHPRTIKETMPASPVSRTAERPWKTIHRLPHGRKESPPRRNQSDGAPRDADLAHEVPAVGQAAGFRALAHHLDHAPDAVVLRAGAGLHFSRIFFGAVPLDGTGCFTLAAWWSKSTVAESQRLRPLAMPFTPFRRVPRGLQGHLVCCAQHIVLMSGLANPTRRESDCRKMGIARMPPRTLKLGVIA